jgi:hypothetical protein
MRYSLLRHDHAKGARPHERGSDAPGRSWHGVQAGGLAVRSVNRRFKYAALPRSSARLSRLATARFRDEPS